MKKNVELELWLESKKLVDVTFPLDEVTMGNLKELLREDVMEETDTMLRDITLGMSSGWFLEHLKVLMYLQLVMDQVETEQKIGKTTSVSPVMVHIETWFPYNTPVETTEVDILSKGHEPGTMPFNKAVTEYIREMDPHWAEHQSEQVFEYRWCLIEAGDPAWQHVVVNPDAIEADKEWTVAKLLRDYGLWVGIQITSDLSINATEITPLMYIREFCASVETLRRHLIVGFLHEVQYSDDTIGEFLKDLLEE